MVRRGDRGPGAAPPPPAFRLLPPLSLRLPRAARHLAKLLMRLGTMQTIARNMKELLSALRADPACLPQPGHQGAPRPGRRCRAVPRHPAGTCMCVGVMWPGLAAVMACYVSCSWYKLCIFVTKCHVVREAARVLPACFAGGPARCSVLSGRRGCAHCHQKASPSLTGFITANIHNCPPRHRPGRCCPTPPSGASTMPRARWCARWRTSLWTGGRVGGRAAVVELAGLTVWLFRRCCAFRRDIAVSSLWAKKRELQAHRQAIRGRKLGVLCEAAW